MLVNGNHLTTIWYEDDLDEVKIMIKDYFLMNLH